MKAVLEDIGRPKAQHGEDLQSPGLGRGPPENVVNHSATRELVESLSTHSLAPFYVDLRMWEWWCMLLGLVWS